MSFIGRFDARGIPVFCVGGCVRDLLRGVTPSDFDLCTPILPGETKALFADVPCIETGIRHGTLTVLWHGAPYEITTYRIDGGYENHRTPKGVTFTQSLSEDCRRRDFTVNAMAYHPTAGLYDFFGGRADLDAHVIRCVGDPAERLSEDALRVLRALRFSSVLDFDIAQDTAAALHSAAPLLACISGERIVAEWKKLLGGVRLTSIFAEYRDVISVFLPCADACGDTDALSRLCRITEDPAERMAGILFLCGIRDERVAAAALSHLPLDRAFSDRASRLCARIPADIPDTPTAVRRAYAAHGELLATTLRLRAAIRPEDLDACERAQRWLYESIARGDPMSRSDLAVTGGALAALGFRGKEIGETLDALLAVVLEDPSQNERAHLLALAHTFRL